VRLPSLLTGTLLVIAPLGAQRDDAATAPRFEVVSVRVNRDASDRPTFMRPILQQGGRVLMTNQTLRELIRTAYGVKENELIGGPGWADMTGFDLEARGPAGMSADTARAMLRALLADRFSLVVHREKRDLPIYTLTMAARDRQRGPQLKPAAAQCSPVTRPDGMPPPPAGSQPTLLMADRGPLRCPSMFRAGHFSARAISMDVLAVELTVPAGRPVVNRTGLTGEFDLDLTYTPDLNAGPIRQPRHQYSQPRSRISSV
jgi:uncharacterized protein (TIGR03435 family)